MKFQVEFEDGVPTTIWTEELGLIVFGIEDDEIFVIHTDSTITPSKLEKAAEATKELPFVNEVTIE